MSDSKQDKFRDLMSAYKSESYTRVETASAVVGLLYTCDSSTRALLWTEFPDWLQKEVREIVSGFDETAPPFALRPGNAIEVHRTLTELKRWWFDEFLGKQ